MNNTRNPFTLLREERLKLDAAPPLRDMYTLSPFVWKAHDYHELLVRAVNHSEVASEKVARIYHGVSVDGLNYAMDGYPVIAPGPDELDRDGCEDPTVALSDGAYFVYYTGWNQARQEGQLLWASGRNIHRLEKRGVAVQSTRTHTNPKEATIVPVEDGSWRLFFEYAQDDASRIGIATSASVSGPWRIQPDLFCARPNAWDRWHLSTGPVLLSRPERPVMFYNGATRDAKWRIGWVAFDSKFERVVARCDAPFIVPPSRSDGASDIAFAASCTSTGEHRCDLFYSVADKEMHRATLRTN